MERMTLKAVTSTTTDAGIFEAVVSTEAIDRERDVVLPSAMVEALKAWTFTGKMVPLHWNHSSDPEDIVGHINPATVKAVAGEVHASGWIDQDTDRGRHVWRLAKSQTLGFSFGYLIPEGGAVKRADGVREIRQLDVFEVSATAAPMNADTRVLSTKAIDDDPDRIPTEAELQREMVQLGLVVGPASAEMYQHADPIMTGTSSNGDHADEKALYDNSVRIQARDAMLSLFAAADVERKAIERKSTERKSTEPIKVETFEC